MFSVPPEAFNEVFPSLPKTINETLVFHLVIPNFRLTTPNSQGNHWTKASRVRKEKRRFALALIEQELTNSLFHLPCTVIITRVSPRKMDDDNNIGACKHIRDLMGNLIIPGLKPGRADGSEFITWKYVQEKKGKGIYEVDIKVYQT
jgi:hypothetical protein